ncbi:hypothetical protein DRJ16_05670 [Candidatus Woesearchaeota archaeon]|nr:MAG: hypothetical protein DRJ16_05670 [Candidatus Woesearchaeota archaeon]
MFEKIKSTKKRVIMKLVVELIKRANTELDIKGLQEKYDATKGKTILIYIEDENLPFAFRVEEGRLYYIKNPERVDYKVIMNSDTFISLLAGKVKRRDPKTGEIYWENYSIGKAWLNGDIVIVCENEGSTNDMVLALKVWEEISKRFTVKVAQKIVHALVK